MRWFGRPAPAGRAGKGVGMAPSKTGNVVGQASALLDGPGLDFCGLSGRAACSAHVGTLHVGFFFEKTCAAVHGTDASYCDWLVDPPTNRSFPEIRKFAEHRCFFWNNVGRHDA